MEQAFNPEPSIKSVKLDRISVNEVPLSVLLPAYNEATRIEDCVQLVERAVKSFSPSYEIIIAEDGSIDGTDAIASRLARNNPKIKNLHSPIRLGKGKAIRRALQMAKGDIVIFLDVDLATNLEYLPKITNIARTRGGIVIGSRYSDGSKVQRPISRKLLSLAYNLLARSLFHDTLRDHQCGFKALSHDLAIALKDKIESDGFFIDTEILVLAKRMGFPITEIAVEWTEQRNRGESKVRLFRDTLKMGFALLRFGLGVNISAHRIKGRENGAAY